MNLGLHHRSLRRPFGGKNKETGLKSFIRPLKVHLFVQHVTQDRINSSISFIVFSSAYKCVVFKDILQFHCFFERVSLNPILFDDCTKGVQCL